MDGSLARYRGYVVMIALFVVTLGVTIYTFRSQESQAEIPLPIATPRATATAEMVIVHVCGAVASPGVYTLPEGSRVQDALQRAGDVVNGDITALNLARKLNDGEQICIPKLGDAAPAPPAAAPAPTPRAASACVPYKDAGTRLNETLCVRGTVSSGEKAGNNFFIYFDDSSTSFYAISFNHTWDNLRNKCVEINGKVALFRGRAQIVIDKLDQLSFCK